MAIAQLNRPIFDIISDAAQNLANLLRAESRLARAEVAENISRAGAGIGMMAFGAILAIPALVVLLEAAVVALMSSGLSAAVAALIVGGVALVIGLVLLMTGMRRVRAASLVPDRTIHQLQRDAAVATQEARHERELHRAA
ncbi:phage holin family protein [Inquilinus limosus]|uniref:phage holin family protein n=1 Tax=Inquilinus limosus TaxID=171674 RepID=UPI003F17AA40